MRTPTLFALAFAATATAGCHMAPCGGCAEYETCSVATNQCALNANTRFDLEAVDGDVPGDNWDPFFGPPDPYICVSAEGTTEQCTMPDSDTHSPHWNAVLLTDLDGTQLLATGLAMRYLDSDLDEPDPICSGALMLQERWIHDGGFSYHCSNGASAQFALHNTDRGTPPL